MNKRNVLEIISLGIATILSIIFVLFKTNNASVIFSFLFFIPSAISIYMFYSFDKIKKCNNKILKIILISIFFLLIIYNLIFLFFLIITSIFNSGNDIFSRINCIFSYVFFILLFAIFIFNFIENDNTAINSNMIIIASTTISLIHIYYFLNPYLRNNTSDVWYDGSSIFIEQNYLYFSIMYIIIIINKFYNRLNFYK